MQVARRHAFVLKLGEPTDFLKNVQSLMREKLVLYLDLIRWNRPAGWLLLLWPTLSALWVATDGFPG